MTAHILSLVGDLTDARTLFPLALAVIIVTYLMMSARRRHQRRDVDQDEDVPLHREPPRARTGEQESLRRDLESLLVELQELSRQISAQIDVKFAKLETVIKDADRRIATLTRLTKEGDGKASPSDEKPAHGAGHDVVYELADAGQNPVEIARKLGKTPGEVELILNLRRQGKADKGRRGT